MESKDDLGNTDGRYTLIDEEDLEKIESDGINQNDKNETQEDEAKLCDFSEQVQRDGNKFNKYLHQVVKPLLIFVLLNPFMKFINNVKPLDNISENNRNSYTKYLIVILTMMLVLIHITIPDSNWRRLLSLVDIIYIILNVIAYSGVKLNRGKFLGDFISRNYK
jgi:hypothetical protein